MDTKKEYILKQIPYGRQSISEADIEAVIEVMRSDFLTQGPIVGAFEKSVAEYCGVKFGVAVNSATSALHIACLSLGVGPGDWVWTSPISFVASANCAIYCGANIDFVDIDSSTYNMSVESLTKKLEKAKLENRLPKVLIPVHLCGQSCDMEQIFSLSKTYGFRIIEDASHAIGGKYKNETIGNCRYSDITVFSFHPVKIITTGEGGMAMTNNLELSSKMQRLRSHGITRDPQEMDCLPDGPWYYQQQELGFNYRMTDMQAALGLSQMKKLNEFVKIRHNIADKYNSLFKGLPFVIPKQSNSTYSSYHLYVIRVKFVNELSRLQVFERLRAAGINVNLHYIPIYHHPYYKKMGFDPLDYPAAESYYSEAISMPIFVGLENFEIENIVKNCITPQHHQNLF